MKCHPSFTLGIAKAAAENSVAYFRSRDSPRRSQNKKLYKSDLKGLHHPMLAARAYQGALRKYSHESFPLLFTSVSAMILNL